MTPETFDLWQFSFFLCDNFDNSWQCGQFVRVLKIWQFWPFLVILTIFGRLDNLTIMTKTIFVTCDIWVTDYNSDNWEPEFMTIFATWQLRVTQYSQLLRCFKEHLYKQNKAKTYIDVVPMFIIFCYCVHKFVFSHLWKESLVLHLVLVGLGPWYVPWQGPSAFQLVLMPFFSHFSKT